MMTFRRFLDENWDTTARFHTALNPSLWESEHLKPHIRSKLLEFADAWAAFAKIPKEHIKDILLVGGSAGYNYTDKSDLDVHLLLDRNKLGPRHLVDELLQTKKSLWGLRNHVRVAGLPVEGYAQDLTESHPKSQGVYSLKNDQWITKPELPPILDLESPAFKSKVQKYIDNIEHLITHNASPEDFAHLKARLREMRSAGLKRGGEYDQTNLVFKTLRDLGILDKMSNYIHQQLIKKLSMEEQYG